MTNPTREKRIAEVMSKRRKDIVVVLEDIYDPHNAAAIFRTCDAYGIQNAYLIFETVEPYDPKKVGKSSSATANKWLDFKIFQSTAKCLTELKREGYSIVSTLLDKEATNLYEFKWPKKIALLVGNEHAGLSKTAAELSDSKVYIPMQGMVQSLNVSVATAICISEVYRSRLRIS